jgi:cell division protein FtsZ
MKFDLPKEQSSIIKVIGVGGGGSNAVKHMYNQGIKGVDFIVCNTDSQALDSSPVPMKIQLGASLTEGRGAGSIPEVGRNAAIENIDDVRAILEKNTHMVFITAGMGGGTGTGAAPIIAQTARELGILTVGIVTIPFGFEGRKRKIQAEEGINAMRKAVDTLLIIKNDKLREIGGNLTLKDAFTHADEVLATAAKGIAEVISVTGEINVDMNDVNTVMRDSGVAIMGSGVAEGENRAMIAVQQALESPLLNDNDIEGARYVLLNITYGNCEVLMDEITDITDYIQDAAGSSADVIWGHAMDESLGDKLCVTLIATGFHQNLTNNLEVEAPEKKYHSLTEEKSTPVSKPITSPVSGPVSFNKPVEAPKATEEVPEPYMKSSPEVEKPAAEEKREEKPEVTVNEEQTTFTFEDFEQPFLKSETASNEIEITQSEMKEDEIKAEEEEKVERTYYTLEDELPAEEEENDRVFEKKKEEADGSLYEASKPLSRDQQQELASQRLQRIKELSVRLKTPSGLSDLENEPAYKRRNIRLNETPHSSDSEVSRYSLSEDEVEGRAGLRENNRFLHDNVD